MEREAGIFLADPTKSNFDQLHLNSAPTAASVGFIVNEALRLYPSTKGVYGKSFMQTKKNPETIVADLLECHRIPTV